MTNLDYALSYRKRGWSIIPIKAGTKLPAIQSWIKYQTAIPTEAEIKTWFTIWPDANIALICGAISNVIVVDIDSGKGEADTKGLELPPTLSQKTGSGGSHLIYKWRKGLIGAKVGIRKNVDIRSDNSYIVIAPSIHPNGTPYEFVDEDEDIADAPAWLEEKSPGKEKEETDWGEFLTEKKGKGLRNMSAAKVAGKILYESSPDMWDTLGLMTFKQWNKELNNPPLGDKELLTVWKSVKKKHLKNNEPPKESKKEKESDEEEIEEELTEEEQEEKEIRRAFIKNKSKGTYTLAKYLTRKYNVMTIGEKEREMYVYQNGVYFLAENEIIFPEIQRILTDSVTKSAKMETYHKIADMTAFPRSVFQSASLNFIPLKNGVYDTETKQLLPHDPKYRFTYQFPVVYDAKAECPKTLAFFNQILTPDQVPTIQEWIGFYFYRLYMFKKAIIFVGEGDTGKTTLLETITNLLGRDNISSVSLQKMTSDKFSAAHLYEKHGNLVDELSARDIADTGNFKIATGGGSISGEYKFGNQFSFHNFSKFTFACNKIPDVKDFDDEAYFNRWMVVRFERRITNKIPNFIQTITTEQERSGLFNYAMEGLERLILQAGFSYAKTAMDTKKEMMRGGSSIAVFCADCVQQEVGAEITKESMYDEYTTYCTENGIPAETMKMFGTKFLFYVSYASEGLVSDYRGSRSTRSRGWRNVVLVKREKQLVEDKKTTEDFDNFGKDTEVTQPSILAEDEEKKVEEKVYAENEINPEDIPF